MKILHLATWYPTEDAPHSVPFIKVHIDALKPFGANKLLHLTVTDHGNPKLIWKFLDNDVSRLVLTGVRGPTRTQEFLTLLLLFCARVRLGRRDWDVVLIHVAWPTFRFPSAVQMMFGSELAILEHWSAYAKDFYLDPASKAHARMRRMFATDTPIIAVSKGLANDIAKFAQREDLQIRVVPNVVDPEFYLEAESDIPTIFMAANWNDFRKPFFVLHAFPALLQIQPELQLVIAGEGPRWDEMKEYVLDRPWSHKVEFMGYVQREKIAERMRQATLFAHPTTHETFSVVAAEAMSCGVPAIISNVGAVPELVIPGKTGLLVENTAEAWEDALSQALAPDANWNREDISKEAGTRFSSEAVGRKLFDILSDVASR